MLTLPLFLSWPLASVVESPVKLCSQDIVDARQMKLFNCHIDP